MVHPWSFINFGLVVKPFGSTLKKVGFCYVRSNSGTAQVDFTLKKVVLGYVRSGVVMLQRWSFMNFLPVIKPFVSILKKVSFVYVRLGVAMVQPWSIMKFGLVVKPFGSNL